MAENTRAETITLRPAWKGYGGPLLPILALAISLIGGWPFVIPVLIGIAVHRYRRRYTITADRITEHVGIITRHERSVRMEDIRSIEVDQGMTDRLFEVGSLSVYSAGDRPEVVLSDIGDPTKIRDAIEDRQRPLNQVAASA